MYIVSSRAKREPEVSASARKEAWLCWEIRFLEVAFGFRRVNCSGVAGGGANDHPNNDAMLLPSPSMLPRPAVDDPVNARWRTPSNSEGTPIALPKRLVSTP